MKRIFLIVIIIFFNSFCFATELKKEASCYVAPTYVYVTRLNNGWLIMNPFSNMLFIPGDTEKEKLGVCDM